MALAHALRDKTESAHRRGDLLEKRRELMEAWAKHIRAEARKRLQLTSLLRRGLLFVDCSMLLRRLSTHSRGSTKRYVIGSLLGVPVIVFFEPVTNQTSTPPPSTTMLCPVA